MFDCSSYLTQHIDAVHKKKPFECSFCINTFGSKYHLNKHFAAVHEREKPFDYPACPPSLKKHVGSVHEKFGRKRNLIKPISAALKQIKTFECSLCSYKSGCKGDLNKHITAVHEKKKPLKCLLCPAKFSQKSNLIGHIGVVHQKMFECSSCPCKFVLEDHLNKHIDAVHGKNSYIYDLSQNVTSKAIKIFLPSQHK